MYYIIIPYRDNKKEKREYHKNFFIENTIPLLKKCLIDVEVIFVVQDEGNPFNRGALINIGVRETNSNPQDILKLILFGRATYNKMMQNLFWATGYNVIAIPLAAGVLYKVNFVLDPAVGAIFMSLSTVIVAINAQLLKSKIESKS